VFFFQAEDGIRDFHVTGVQTCALPICCWTWLTSSSTWTPMRTCGPALTRSTTNFHRPDPGGARSGWRGAPPPTHGDTPMTDILNHAETSEFAGLDADDLQSLRRKYTADYLKAREAHEDSPTDNEAWTLYQSWAGTLVEILVAAGDYQTVEDAGTA